MLYEIKARYTADDGKTVKVHYLLDAELFAQAEVKAYEQLQDKKDVDVVSIKRSTIKEVIKEDNDLDYYVATVSYPYIDDKGNEKIIRYKQLLPASTIGEAHEVINDYLNQGYDMRLDAIKLTTINAVL